MKICFLLSYSPNPRMKKRMGLLKDSYPTSLIYWKRSEEDIWGKADGDIETIEINVLSNNGNPLKRLIPTLKFAYQVIKSLKRIKPECIYVENIDMLLIAKVYSFLRRRKVKYIYEIADIHGLLIDYQKSYIKRLIQKTLRKLDSYLCREIDILINTSDKFYEMYYHNYVPEEKLIVMPNMPNLTAFTHYNKKKEGRFTVGFIGAIRYKDQMKMLIRVAERCNINVVFAGAGIDKEIENLCKGKKWITYLGEYDYNSEVANLYGMVDCIYSVYNADLSNVRIALPNKLYESIYCELPILVAKGTYLAELVDEMGVGIAISHKDENELEQTLKRLSYDRKYYSQYVEACFAHKGKINNDYHNKKLKSLVDLIMEN